MLHLADGSSLLFDHLALATGSYPFVPPIEGHTAPGAFVYRTIDDLEAIANYAAGCRTGIVVGGGLLGLEAANALRLLELHTSVVEFAPRLMPQQLDEAGSKVMRRKIEALGINVYTSHAAQRIVNCPQRGVVTAHTDGWAALAEHLQTFTADYVTEICGIDGETLTKVALKIGHSPRALIAWTMGVNHSIQGAETVAVINTLCAITGNIGRAGAATLSITGQCNAMGTRETGFTASMPGYRNYDDPNARGELAELWAVDPSRLPTTRGLAYPDIIEGIIGGKIKALWVIGTNPVVSFPNRELLEHALNKLELLVVQDGFETPTTAMAHVTLPAAIWGEKEGTFTNSERRVSRVRKLVEPPGAALSDFDIFMDIADRLGVRDELFPGWKQPQEPRVR